MSNKLRNIVQRFILCSYNRRNCCARFTTLQPAFTSTRITRNLVRDRNSETIWKALVSRFAASRLSSRFWMLFPATSQRFPKEFFDRPNSTLVRRFSLCFTARARLANERVSNFSAAVARLPCVYSYVKEWHNVACCLSSYRFPAIEPLDFSWISSRRSSGRSCWENRFESSIITWLLAILTRVITSLVKVFLNTCLELRHDEILIFGF